MCLTLFVLGANARAGAQDFTHPHPELRIDGISPHPSVLEAGVGPEIPLGYYTRLELLLAGGVARDRGAISGSGRGDVVTRFLLDPFRESRWGLSVGGGVSIRYEPDRGWRDFLVAVVDLEAPQLGRVMPAVQVGLGGGARVGMVLRRAVAGRR